MADEIAQVCEMEIEGVKIAIKGSVEVAQMLARMLRAIIKHHKDSREKSSEKKLNEPGEKIPSQIMKMSEGPAEILQVSDRDLQELVRLGEKNGLHFSYTIDFDANDKRTPIYIPAQEMALWGMLLKTVHMQHEAEDQDMIASYGKQLSEEKEKLLNASPEEKDAIQTKIKNLTQAKTEAEEWINEENEYVNSEHPSITLMDYLKQAKGTEFEMNPEKAVAEMDQGVELGGKLSAKECFQPIRAKCMIPDTKYFFYYPDTGSVVTRQFHVDEDTGLVYSNYALKTKEGEIYQYSDKGMTKDMWNEQKLPNLLDKAGMIEGTQCRMFDTQEKLKDYITKHNNVKSQAEIDIENKIRAGEPVFQSAETEREIVNAVNEKHKGIASAKVDENIVTISMDPNTMFRQGGKLSIRLEDGQTLLIGSMTNERIENGKATFDIKRDDPVVLVEKNATQAEQFHQINGEKCLDIINKASAAAQGMDIAKKQGTHR